MNIFRSSLFGLVAADLGWAPPIRYLLRRARILRILKRLRPGSMVEVGCGAGALLDDFAGHGFRAVGLETSPDALALARALAVRGGKGQEIFDTIGFEWRGSMDLVCAFDVLEHIERDDEVLAQWKSWLRPDGKIIVSVPAHRRRWSAGDEWAGHWRRYDRADIVGLLHGQGFSIVSIECYGFPLANITEWLGVKSYRRMLAARTIHISKESASANSGIDRQGAKRLFRYLNSVVGRPLLRLGFLLQAMTAHTNWGSGYIILAIQE